MPTETAWKARFARLWNACEKADVAARALAHQRVAIALEAYRQVALPGLPGPAVLGRVASVNEETARRALAALKADAR
jgi:methylaspartate ammonia-lyase